MNISKSGVLLLHSSTILTFLLAGVVVLSSLSCNTIIVTEAYSITPPRSTTSSSLPSRTISASAASTTATETSSLLPPPLKKQIQTGLTTIALTTAITLSSTVGLVHADDDIDSTTAMTSSLVDSTTTTSTLVTTPTTGEDTIETVLQNLKSSQGDTAASFKVFEQINEIITEGAGVGGSLSYKGVNLERGYVADEDTTIYNPGLSLLTESEKSSIINAVIENRKANVASNTWNQDNEYAFEFLKTRLDPLHMIELSGYLKVLPILGGIMYVLSLAVQQFARGLFEVSYVVSALVVFIPIFVLIAVGV